VCHETKSHYSVTFTQLFCWPGALRERSRQELGSCSQTRGEEPGFVSGAGMLCHAETCPSATLLLLASPQSMHLLLLSQTCACAPGRSGVALPVTAFAFISYFPFGLSLPLIRQDFKKGQTVSPMPGQLKLPPTSLQDGICHFCLHK